MNKRIWLSLAHMGGHEQNFIKEAFDTNWVVPLGPNVDGFEKDLEVFIGERRHVVALCSGTAALHLGLILLGIKPGDEVICQSFTFAASANPIIYMGARPVFVDSEKETWNMDPAALEEAVKDRIAKTGRLPKAIIPVHLYGMPAKMDEINRIASNYGIPILEDAAEAMGSELEGYHCGTLGHLGIFSFNGNKMITTSGGGALICRTKEEADKAKFYATQARDKAPYYQHSQIGYNYRMSNICAGIGRGQMLVVGEHVIRRRAIHVLYKELFLGVEGITVMDKPSAPYNSNFWLTCVLVNSELAGFTNEELRIHLESKNIESRPLWKPMHLQPVYAQFPFYGTDISGDLFNHGLCLPSGPCLDDDDIQRVAETIKAFCVVFQ